MLVHMFSHPKFVAPTRVPEGAHFIVINAGSSSIKLVIFEASTLNSVARADAKLIGQANGSINTWAPGHNSPDTTPMRLKDSAHALGILLDWVASILPTDGIAAVGHRIVHGGSEYGAPILITSETYPKLEALVHLDRLHMVPQLETVRLLAARLPKAAQVACFDTAFHHDMPAVAQLIPVPKKYRDTGVRRFGFHGLSYTYIRARLAELDGEEAMRGRVVIAHLGSGASLAAMHNGKPVDTTMSFTTNSGIGMSTRTGDIDPGVALYLKQETGLSLEDFTHIATSESGLLGISGTTADMYQLLQSENSDPNAAAAVEYFVYQAKKAIGALATTMGGIDTLVFTGGIGEQSAPIRKRICEGLEFLGLYIDESGDPNDEGILSTLESRIKARLIFTNEELVIARHIAELQHV